MTSILYSILIPIIASLLSAITKKHLRSSINITSAILCFINTTLHWQTNLDYIDLNYLEGLPIVLNIDNMGYIFALMISFLYIPASIYTIGYFDYHNDGNQSRFFVFFNLSIASTIGIAFSGNLITMFLFYEILTLSTYPLVTHYSTEESIKAGRIYIGHLMGTSLLFFLPAIFFSWYHNGSFDFVQLNVSPEWSILIFCLYIYGIGKIALFPLHSWLPSAMVAPTPVSALLHAVAVVKSGVFILIKISTYMFIAMHCQYILLIIASITVLVSSFMALNSDTIKARLAYSTISQLSYICLGISQFANTTTHAIFQEPLITMSYMIFHSFAKITLFFVAGIIYSITGITKIKDVAGLGKIIPIPMISFAIGSLAMIGLPPTVNFWAKTLLINNSQEITVTLVILLSTILNVVYLMTIVYDSFFGSIDQKVVIKPKNFNYYIMATSSSITALIVVISFFLLITTGVLI